MFEQCRIEIQSQAAARELDVAEAAFKYQRAVTERLDRDDKIIQEAIDLACWLKNNELVKKLKSLRNDVTIPYESIVGMQHDHLIGKDSDL